MSWTGGHPDHVVDNAFQSNYLQIFECWGDPQSTDPATTDDPGPLPTQCQFGAETISSSAYPVKEPGFEYSRVLTQQSWSDYDVTVGTSGVWTDPSTGFVVAPFQAVDGTVVDQQADYNYDLDPNNPKPFWLNPYFRYGTSNEVDFARTYADGTGHAAVPGPDRPRGSRARLRPEPATGRRAAATPGPPVLAGGRAPGHAGRGEPGRRDRRERPDLPAHPDGLGQPDRHPPRLQPGRVELLHQRRRPARSSATSWPRRPSSSWQPALCDQPGSPSSATSRTPTTRPGRTCTDPTYGAAGMSVFSDPADPCQVDPSNPVVYAPLTLSGVVGGVQHPTGARPVVDGQSADRTRSALAGTQVGHIYLTPRLMAKLLTQSYQAQLQNVTATKPAGLRVGRSTTRSTCFTDPDFLQWNPEFSLLSTAQAIDAGTALVEEASSDAASAVWKWILADPEAGRGWTGKPDPWGMQVNPYLQHQPVDQPGGRRRSATRRRTTTRRATRTATRHRPASSPGRRRSRPARSASSTGRPTSLTMAGGGPGTGAANDGAKTTFNPALTAEHGVDGQRAPGPRARTSSSPSPTRPRPPATVSRRRASAVPGTTRRPVAHLRGPRRRRPHRRRAGVVSRARSAGSWSPTPRPRRPAPTRSPC